MGSEERLSLRLTKDPRIVQSFWPLGNHGSKADVYTLGDF